MEIFYAIWKPFGFEEAFDAFGMQKQNGYYKMQDMKPEICNAIAESSEKSTITLIDIRDNSTYTVAKLLDNKCWMTQGLRIVNKTISSSDSNMTSGSFSIKSSNISAFINSNDNNDAVYYNNNINDGAYYTWHTATAGTGTNSTPSGTNASSSICPKGWRLPTGNTNGDFANLNKAYGGNGTNNVDISTRNKLIQSPVPHFTYNGDIYYGDGTIHDYNTIGNYWSSTSAGAANQYDTAAYDFYFYADGNLFPVGSDIKRFGLSVRCVSI